MNPVGRRDGRSAIRLSGTRHSGSVGRSEVSASQAATAFLISAAGSGVGLADSSEACHGGWAPSKRVAPRRCPGCARAASGRDVAWLSTAADHPAGGPPFGADLEVECARARPRASARSSGSLAPRHPLASVQRHALSPSPRTSLGPIRKRVIALQRELPEFAALGEVGTRLRQR